MYRVEKADKTQEQKKKENISGGGTWSNSQHPMPKKKCFIIMGDNTDTKTKESIARGLYNRILNLNGNIIAIWLRKRISVRFIGKISLETLVLILIIDIDYFFCS